MQLQEFVDQKVKSFLQTPGFKVSILSPVVKFELIVRSCAFLWPNKSVCPCINDHYNARYTAIQQNLMLGHDRTEFL